MADIAGLVSACGSILGGIVTIIEQSTQAWDRTKNGKQYLDSVVIQVKITKQILEEVGGGGLPTQSEGVRLSIGRLQEKAMELSNSVKELERSPGDGGLKIFLSEFFHGNARAEKFDRMQRDLYQAQTLFITSLVAARYHDTNVYHIDLKALRRVESCFKKWNSVPPILQLLRDRGTPVGNGEAVWQIKEEDLKQLAQEVDSTENRTVRVMTKNEMKDFAMMMADIGAQGEAAPIVDEVMADGNMLEGNALLVAGPVTFETARDMQKMRANLDAENKMLEAALVHVKEDRQTGLSYFKERAARRG